MVTLQELTAATILVIALVNILFAIISIRRGHAALAALSSALATAGLMALAASAVRGS